MIVILLKESMKQRRGEKIEVRGKSEARGERKSESASSSRSRWVAHWHGTHTESTLSARQADDRFRANYDASEAVKKRGAKSGLAWFDLDSRTSSFNSRGFDRTQPRLASPLPYISLLRPVVSRTSRSVKMLSRAARPALIAGNAAMARYVNEPPR